VLTTSIQHTHTHTHTHRTTPIPWRDLLASLTMPPTTLRLPLLSLFEIVMREWAAEVARRGASLIEGIKAIAENKYVALLLIYC
jgi:hypothetical protein